MKKCIDLTIEKPRAQTVLFTSRINSLKQEFQDLKKELFGNSMFVICDYDDPKMIRYQQLLGFFKPWLRTTDWKNPLDESLNNAEIMEV